MLFQSSFAFKEMRNKGLKGLIRSRTDLCWFHHKPSVPIEEQLLVSNPDGTSRSNVDQGGGLEGRSGPFPHGLVEKLPTNLCDQKAPVGWLVPGVSFCYSKKMSKFAMLLFSSEQGSNLNFLQTQMAGLNGNPGISMVGE